MRSRQEVSKEYAKRYQKARRFKELKIPLEINSKLNSISAATINGKNSTLRISFHLLSRISLIFFASSLLEYGLGIKLTSSSITPLREIIWLSG